MNLAQTFSQSIESNPMTIFMSIFTIGFFLIVIIVDHIRLVLHVLRLEEQIEKIVMNDTINRLRQP